MRAPLPVNRSFFRDGRIGERMAEGQVRANVGRSWAHDPCPGSVNTRASPVYSFCILTFTFYIFHFLYPP